MTSKDIREKYISFFVGKRHKEIAPTKLVPENDSSTLFISSGMQPLIPYLLGEEHPAGKRLVNCQLCFRAEDIEEVGDNRHTTFFEMLGNWSLGDYFKEDQLEWCWEFLTKKLKLPKEKLYVSVFKGSSSVPKDIKSYEIWKSLGIPEDHVYFYGSDKNWWSRSGTPDKMPVGEIGGPDSEIFYEFTQVDHDSEYGEKCHPNCPCGRFLEIGNSVFIQFQKKDNGSLKELSQKNVDFGGGLERLTAAVNNTSDIFETELYKPIVEEICEKLGTSYEKNKQYIQIIADHIKASVFLIKEGVMPSNKLQGYILRRLLRRVVTKAFLIDKQKSDSKFFRSLIKSVTDIYPKHFEGNAVGTEEVVSLEIRKFRKTLERGLKQLDKSIKDNEDLGLAVFNLFQSYGYPLELTIELLKERGIKFTDLDMVQFEKGKKSHVELSRTASSGMFKGGLADHSEIVTKYHTATHLLHQSLRDVLGSSVFQKGSNITLERLRFDFSFERKMTDEEIKQVEDLVNEKIKEDLTVTKEVMDKEKALQSGALGFFTEKYGDKVTVYSIADPSTSSGSSFSREICGGPHVERTGVIGKIKITKEESVSSGIRRIRAKIVLR
ncbi:alanine--tRNA ligase [Patescibacteria group bacterium]|nr:alanine--tRNA ligase [Patescibacteria group bacterium]